MKKAVELRKSNVSNPILSLRDDISELFDNWFNQFGQSVGNMRPLRLIKGEMLPSWPRVDLVEENNEIVITAEIPGYAEKDIDLNVTRDLLTIKGVHTENRDEEDKNYHLRERYLGSFERTVPLPVDVDVDRCEAEFKHGLLCIRMPKTRDQNKQVHKVKIKSV